MYFSRLEEVSDKDNIYLICERLTTDFTFVVRVAQFHRATYLDRVRNIDPRNYHNEPLNDKYPIYLPNLSRTDTKNFAYEIRERCFKQLNFLRRPSYAKYAWF